MTHSCYNRAPLAATIVVQDGWITSAADDLPVGAVFTRQPRMVVIENKLSKKCQYSLHAADPKCSGCVWNRAEQLDKEAS